MRNSRTPALGLAALVLLTGCEAVESSSNPPPTTGPTTGPPASTLSSSPTPAPDPSPSKTQKPTPARWENPRAMRDIRRLALDIGPRLATGPNFKRAANLVARRFEGLGFAVTRQDIDVPAGNSWGVAVRAGRSQNIIARSKDFDPSQDYVLVGAHLDTVAVAPGAEDNASGISVLLESARVIGASKRQIVFVAFGAEEPVGTGEALHHFGSTEYVARMTRTERAHLTGMVALDRVSVGTVVPLCTGGISPTTIRDQLERIAGRLKIPTSVCDNNAASDHWSFEQVGFPVARIGSTPYFGYHSIHDLPEVVNPAQLQRVGRLVTAWLRGD